MFNMALIALTFASFIYVVASPFGKENYVRIADYLFLGAALFIVFISFFENHSFKRMVPLLAILFVCFLSLLIGGVSSKSIVSFLWYFAMLSIWIATDLFDVHKNTLKFIKIAIIIEGLILIVLFFTDRAYFSYTQYGGISKELTLGFNNPNETGLILFFIISFLVIIFNNSRRLFLKIICLLEMLFLFFLLVKTDARTSLIATIFLLLFTILFWLKKHKPHLNLHSLNSWAVFCIIFPLLFFIGYSIFSKVSSLESITFLGKKVFSGRERVYNESILSWNNYAFGNMSSLAFSNAHNGLLTILINTGLIGIVFYLVFVIREVFFINQKMLYRRKFLFPALIVYLIFLISSAEATVLVGGTIFYFYELLTLTIFHHEFKNE